MSRVVVDTHTAVWFRTERSNLSAQAVTELAAADTTGEILVSAITLVELRYLVEKGRLLPTVLQAIETAIDDPTTAMQLVPLDRTVTNALANIPRDIVPDMPDRIIAATALALGLPLVTRDSEIRKLTNVTTVW